MSETLAARVGPDVFLVGILYYLLMTLFCVRKKEEKFKTLGDQRVKKNNNPISTSTTVQVDFREKK